MDSLLPAFAAIALGLTGLVWGADRFVTGSAGAARNLGISPLVIGLTIVSIGTSAPEIIVSVNAALRQAGELAVGNALGSNLANIGLVLGITALVAPLPTQRHLLTQEGPILLLVTLWAGILLANGTLGRWESLPLLLALPVLLWLTIRLKRHHPPAGASAEEDAVEIPNISMPAAVLWFVLGLAVMLVGSEALVWGATTSARALGVSELVIGLTIVAVGTSLPELAASVVSAVRGHHDIAIGNVFGSNLFNLMAVMPIAGIISPLSLGSVVFARDFASLAILTVLLYVAILWVRRPGAPQGNHLSRPMGLALLLAYLLYYLLLAV